MAERHAMILRLGYLADPFLKVNEVKLSLQGKQLTVFCC